LIRDSELVVDRVRSTIEDLLFSPDKLQKMSDAALTVAHPRAAEELSAWVLSLARRS
jgi:UDP-N-acetylglucosamine:LPS N-acetylglucosamine transferase